MGKKKKSKKKNSRKKKSRKKKTRMRAMMRETVVKGKEGRKKEGRRKEGRKKETSSGRLTNPYYIPAMPALATIHVVAQPYILYDLLYRCLVANISSTY